MVSRDPGVVEVRVPVGGDRGGVLEVRVRAGDGPPRRAPMLPDPLNPTRMVARVTVGPVRAGEPLRLEVWEKTPGGENVGGTLGGWTLRTPLVVKPGPVGMEDVPDWAKGMVWYQVFPERFRNGNPANDPYHWGRTVVGWGERFHEVSLEEVEMHWNRRGADPARFSNDPDRWWGAFGQVVFARRYGGDLQGVVDRLDKLDALGVTGLYLCPVFDAFSLHKYEASDHRHVDPTLGDPGTPGGVDRSGEDPLDERTWGWEPADRYLVDVLLPEARERGMRVILDGVWNHVGREHFAFRDVLENGERSAYAGWFKADFDEKGRLSGYEAWDGRNGNLPEFRQTPGGDLAPGTKAHVFAVTRRWMDPNGDGDSADGVDGWRLDVAPEVGRVFWREWRGLVRSINPDALLVGEVWSDAEPWFNGAAFDAQMNYPLAYPIADWLSIGRDANDAARTAERINAVFAHRPAHDLAQMTLIASHDTERGASLMHNDFDRGFDSMARPWAEGSAYDAGPVDGDAKRRLLAAYGLLTVLPGSPMVYNGDEFALPGADDPDNRRPIPWAGDAPTPDDPDLAFRDCLAGLLGLRATRGGEGVRGVGTILRFGLVECVGVPGADALLVRRRLDDRMVEAVVARSGEVVFPEIPAGWALEGHVLDAGEGSWGSTPIRVRVLKTASDR